MIVSAPRSNAPAEEDGSTPAMWLIIGAEHIRTDQRGRRRNQHTQNNQQQFAPTAFEITQQTTDGMARVFRFADCMCPASAARSARVRDHRPWVRDRFALFPSMRTGAVILVMFVLPLCTHLLPLFHLRIVDFPIRLIVL